MKELLEKLRESLGENFSDLTKPYVEQDGLKAAAEQVEQIIAPSSEVSFETQEIEELIKIFTVLDKREIYSRGSASPVIILLRQLRTRQAAPNNNDPLDWVLETKEFEDLLDWVLKTNDCKNEYIPTDSTSHGGSRSLAEFRSMYGDYKASEASKAKARSDALEMQRINKKERARVRAEETIWNAIRRNDTGAINAFMKKSGNLDLRNAEGVSVRELLSKTEIEVVAESPAVMRQLSKDMPQKTYNCEIPDESARSFLDAFQMRCSDFPQASTRFF